MKNINKNGFLNAHLQFLINKVLFLEKYHSFLFEDLNFNEFIPSL